MLWTRNRETDMFSSIRLKDPCQARTTRIDESWERGAIDFEFLSQYQSIAESCEEHKSGDRYV